MHAANNALLGQAITAANGWRTTASGVGVDLTQINFVFPDGRPLVLIWDVEASDWLIDT